MIALLLALACTLSTAHPVQAEAPDDDQDTQDGEDVAELLGTIPAWFDLDVDGVGGGAPVFISGWDDADPLLVSTSGDCDDSRSDISPGAVDACDGVDNNCDGMVDEDAPVVTLYLDADGDRYGSDGTASPMAVLAGCAPWATVEEEGQWTELAGDCDDTTPAIAPYLLDPPGGADANCDGDPDH